MGTFVISYDLVKTKDYESLFEKIKSYGTWSHPLLSTWVVVSNKSATQIRDDLLTVLDDDDRLFIVESSGNSSWKNVRCRSEWLQKYM